MRRAILLGAVLALVLATPVSGAKGMSCSVSAPISAADLNAGGMWYFEVFGAKPNVTYWAMVTWAADPSNGGHYNTSIETDATGYGKTTLPGYWAPDGFLPGHFVDNVWIADAGEFKVRVGARLLFGGRGGSANCAGEVLP